MRTIIFRYLNGLSQFYRRNDDSDIYVMLIFILIESMMILCFSAIFRFHIPTSEELGNKWVIRLLSGLILWVVNKYIFGIKQSVYEEYIPFSKGITILVTLFYFLLSIGFLFYHSKNHQ